MNITLNKIFLNVIVCLISIQITILVGQLVGLLPVNLSLLPDLLAESMPRLYPKWDLLLYGVFIASAGMGSVISNMVLRFKLSDPNWWRITVLYTAVEFMMTFLLISAVFKMTIYDNSPFLAKYCLYILLGVCVLMKIF